MGRAARPGTLEGHSSAGEWSLLTHDMSNLQAHWGPMVRVAHSVLGSWDEAEECAAQALAQVAERQPANIRNLEAFLVTIARRRALDRYRTIERNRRRDSALASREAAWAVDVAEDVVARHAARWLEMEAQRRLTPRAYRLLRAAADGQAVDTIAREESMTVRAVQSSLQRSRTLLRDVWARSLAVFGAAAALMRRAFVGAAPPAVAAALWTLLVVVPNFSANPAPVPPTQSDSSDGHDPNVVPGVSAIATPRGPTRTPRQSVSKPTPSEPSTVMVVHGPGGTSTTIDDREHGSGGDEDLVGGLVECLKNFKVTRENIGC